MLICYLEKSLGEVGCQDYLRRQTGCLSPVNQYTLNCIQEVEKRRTFSQTTITRINDGNMAVLNMCNRILIYVSSSHTY